MLKTALLIGISACSTSANTSKLEAGLINSANCTSEAIPNDDIDDREALQATLNRSGCVSLLPGVYRVSVDPAPGQEHIASLLLTGKQSIGGVGPASVLKFYGNGLKADWRGIRFTGDDNSLSDVTLDSSELYNTDEQSHTVDNWGGERNSVSRVWFYHPQRPGSGGEPGYQAGGDCLRLGGEEENPSSIVVSNNHFVLCDRSGISVQRGVYGLTVVGNLFYDTGDQDIDAEMTGSGSGGQWVISSNVFLRGKSPQGAWSVALAGTGEATDIVFSNNTMQGRGLNLYNVNKASVSNNIIIRTHEGTDAALSVVKASDKLVISGNSISRTESAGPGPVISATHHNGGNPGSLIVTGNLLRNETNAPVGVFESVRRLSFTDNVAEFEPRETRGLVPAVTVAGVAQKTEALVFSSNLVNGPVTWGLLVSGNYVGVGHVSVVGNVAADARIGLECDGSRIESVVSTGNAWTNSHCSISSKGN